MLLLRLLELLAVMNASPVGLGGEGRRLPWSASTGRLELKLGGLRLDLRGLAIGADGSHTANTSDTSNPSYSADTPYSADAADAANAPNTTEATPARKVHIGIL